jgi:hypothetical protein
MRVRWSEYTSEKMESQDLTPSTPRRTIPGPPRCSCPQPRPVLDAVSPSTSPLSPLPHRLPSTSAVSSPLLRPPLPSSVLPLSLRRPHLDSFLPNQTLPTPYLQLPRSCRLISTAPPQVTIRSPFPICHVASSPCTNRHQTRTRAGSSTWRSRTHSPRHPSALWLI